MLGVPASWKEDQVLDMLEKAGLDSRADPRPTLTLFPDINSPGLQVGLLMIERGCDIIGCLANSDHDNDTKVLCKENITIDRYFYGLTPLNTPSGTPVAEYVHIPTSRKRSCRTFRYSG